MRLLHPPIDLNAPKGEDEIEYTPLQLSRLRRSAINFQRVVIFALILFFLGGLAAVVSARSADQQILNQRTQARYNECVRANEQSEKAANAERRSAEVLIATSNRIKARDGEPLTTPADAAAYIADQVAGARDVFPTRSCSPKAIEAHYTRKANK